LCLNKFSSKIRTKCWKSYEVLEILWSVFKIIDGFKSPSSKTKLSLKTARVPVTWKVATSCIFAIHQPSVILFSLCAHFLLGTLWGYHRMIGVATYSASFPPLCTFKISIRHFGMCRIVLVDIEVEYIVLLCKINNK